MRPEFIHSGKYIKKIKERWEDTFSRFKKWFDLEPDVNFTNIIFENRIVPEYTINRYYHTLDHLESMISGFKEYRHSFGIGYRDMTTVELAIWFHDLIYDPKSIENEKKSAEHLVAFAQALNLPNEIVEELYFLVMVTTHKGIPQTKNEDAICDLDLIELSSSKYVENAKNVRKEYSFLTNEEWKKGRLDFLNSMLEKKSIFHTDIFKDTLEVPARQNMQMEIDYLNTK